GGADAAQTHYRVRESGGERHGLGERQQRQLAGRAQAQPDQGVVDRRVLGRPVAGGDLPHVRDAVEAERARIEAEPPEQQHRLGHGGGDRSEPPQGTLAPQRPQTGHASAKTRRTTRSAAWPSSSAQNRPRNWARALAAVSSHTAPVRKASTRSAGVVATTPGGSA